MLPILAIEDYRQKGSYGEQIDVLLSVSHSLFYKFLCFFSDRLNYTRTSDVLLSTTASLIWIITRYLSDLTMRYELHKIWD